MKKSDFYFDKLQKKAKIQPITGGEIDAYRVWKNYKKYGDFVCNDIYKSSAEDFIKALREAGIDSFIYTDSSSGLMEGIHILYKLGCKIIGTEVVNLGELQSDEIIKKRGIRISIKKNN